MRVACTLPLFFLACGAAPAGPGFGGPSGEFPLPGTEGSTAGSSSSSSSSSSGAGGSADTSTASSTGGSSGGDGTSSDAGGTGETSPGPLLGCGGKLDFVFVLSRSINQEKHQPAYLPALPVFIDTIVSRFSDYDVHVLVTDTDATWGEDACASCDLLGDCAEIPDYPCGFEPDECDLTLGAGQTSTAGFGAANKQCTFASGKRWIELPGEPDPTGAFLCAAQVGWSYPGYGEQVGAALKAAGYIPCNLGFRRSDALLVITIISGPEDDDTPGYPYQWRDKLVQWVAGNEYGVVLLVLVDDSTEPDGGVCKGLVGPPRMKQLADSLPYGRWASICAPAAPFFEENVALVEEACDLYIPQ